ncbi:MAG TPA: hydrogenase maturation protease [Bryobacteraceae bacterium]|nr:hydrogenase maturation protease [Bryobacteraceae bacterium]
MLRTLLIATGNRLRRDDGVAQSVLERLGPASGGVETRALLQLTPEVAEDIAPYDAVIFIDADAGATELGLAQLDELPSSAVLTHVSRPADIVALSRALFGFTGRAFLCRIPVDDLSLGEGLSRRASAIAAQATEMVRALLSSPDTN